MNSQSHNLRMMSEAKEVREYTDKQEARCTGLLNRLSRIQIELLHSHSQEQFRSVTKQPPKKFGIKQRGRKLSTSSSSLKYDPELRAMGILSSDSLLGTTSGSQSPSYSQYDDNLPNVIVRPKEPKRNRRNPLYDTPLWKMPDIADMQHVNSTFHSVLRQTSVGNLDLDETESSSGDSSCDETMFIQEEADGTSKRVTHYLPVEDNPTYKFAEDRAKVIAMWTWLQDAISTLSYKIKQQDEFLKHLVQAKPPFQLDEQPAQAIHRPSNSRAPPNAALKDACIQIFTANNNSQVPPTSTQVFYAGERKSPYMTDASGKVIQLIPPNDPTSPQRLPNGGNTKSGSPNKSNSSQDNRNSNIVGGGLESLGLTVQINNDPSCTARRCMPLKPFKQRKIYQLGGIHNMSSFAGRAPTLLCTCFGRTELCAVCSGRARKTKIIDVEVMDQKEIHELLDHNYHRTLSLPDETPIATLIESALIREGWTGRVPRKKMKFRRLAMAWERPRRQWDREAQLDEFGLKKRPRGRPRLPRGLDQFGHIVIKHPKPAATVLSPHANVTKRPPTWRKERRVPVSRRASYGGDVGFRRSIKISRKKYNSVSSAKGLTRRRREREAAISEDEGLYDADFQNYDEFISDGFTTNKSDKRLSQSGRKLNQDYDIDNIVIPYSIASSARVEKVEYKEILTPSWRVVPNCNPEEGPGADEPCQSDDEFDIQTDLNEESIKIRHDRCEVDEHKRFNSIPDKSSRRGRRLDSRTESMDLSFSNPEDSPGTADLQDVVVVAGPPSPILPPSVAEVDEGTLEPQPGTSFGSYGRRRTTSFTSTSNEVEESRIEMDWGPRATPFEPRQFPLTDEEYETMNREMPVMEEDFKMEARRFSPTTVQNMSRNFQELGVEVKEEDGDLELMDVGEDSEGDGDDPDWQRAPGERAA